VVVRGVAGRREEYRPITSALVGSCQPLDVANAFRERFGFAELYLADLDAIGGGESAWPTYAELHATGFQLWLDAGIRNAQSANQLRTAGVPRIIAGLETVPGLKALANIAGSIGPESLVFSLDLKNDEPWADRGVWPFASPEAIADAAVATGVRRIIVLDISRVGVSQGPGCVELCRRIRLRHPHVELLAGGGVRDCADLLRLRDAGVNAVLVASALHDGRITRQGVESLR
jgi:phosphoribosylformimino-5-aminoimidazole carboxamide ribotide isomerase